jgi:hypothetical protein
MPHRISYLTAHSTSVGSFYAGLLLAYPRGEGTPKMAYPRGEACAIGCAKNGVPSPEGTPNGVVFPRTLSKSSESS